MTIGARHREKWARITQRTLGWSYSTYYLVSLLVWVNFCRWETQMADPMADKDSSSTTKNSNDNAIIATVFLASHLLVWIYTDRLFMNLLKAGLDWWLKLYCSALGSIGSTMPLVKCYSRLTDAKMDGCGITWWCESSTRPLTPMAQVVSHLPIGIWHR